MPFASFSLPHESNEQRLNEWPPEDPSDNCANWPLAAAKHEMPHEVEIVAV
jgi:hypothetical protein